VLGFTVNVPGTDRVLTHITWRSDPPPRQWQPIPSMLVRAAEAGVPTCVIGRAEFAGSGLTTAAYGPARYVGAANSAELAERTLDELNNGTRLVYAYHPTVDTIAHLHGIASADWGRAVASVGRLLDRLTAALPAGAALLVTADHGALDVPAGSRLDIDADAGLADGLRVVAGEPRVRYLHTHDGACDDVIARWRERLGARAMVMSREQAVADGWFGPVPAEHLARIGDVVVVCLDDTVVLATRHEPETVARLVAFHGSVTAAETAIPLMSFRSQRG
jgi:hypothetical protein